ncbi:diguanylate cyclase (GGDEF) domain-containing protein [Maridesulfovibrio ferrireducens]|uniref:diguanylate cyclase n=1 Tax=Maridesulfovibrio ferrireducens TaxID=246191 RepID=A0A1G9JU54_9BACT|nr:diguanylate cyclase [Maridesulfovibrio ferrireducens]SDL41011.1 diguanylate cyclase (GGDEF) domain-containing protein [Maridesulfovibrio ferrireducens]
MDKNNNHGLLGLTKHKCILISSDNKFKELLRDIWSEETLEFICYSQARGAIEDIFNNPPDLLIVDNRVTDISASEVARLVKSENVYRQLPVIICLDEKDLSTPWDWNEIEVDDFIVRPFFRPIVRERVNLTLCRAVRALDANPLSKLPGNTSIINKIQTLIDKNQDFALAYCDLDYFKSFNDKYGFSRGDEVLSMTARIIVNTVRGFVGEQTFVGHVGGDDFVVITSPDIVEEACKRIIFSFDGIVPNFYDIEDRKRKTIVSTDRQGVVQTFPLMAISIAVVFNIDGKLKHFGEASAIAMGLKKKAKENPKSNYVLDRRTP